MEFSTISQCATQTLGLPGIRYDLPARELICLDIETIVETQLFDGLVIVTTCDKTIPGALLGAARLNLPTVIVPGGIMEPGKIRGQEVSLADLDEKVFSGKTTARQTGGVSSRGDGKKRYSLFASCDKGSYGEHGYNGNGHGRRIQLHCTYDGPQL